ncbi:hypothetical protein, partial [Sphingobacterium daejeonense]|uniref:hypothetical protein n=1 Tax=Sphingobacterium daejeonense TaxID=371142 RepID=UPI003D318FCD
TVSWARDVYKRQQEGGGMRQHGGTFRPYYPIWADDVWTPENPNAQYPRPVGYNWQESVSYTHLEPTRPSH